MHVMTKYPDCIFCWVDLTTTDVDAAKRFYAGLFGWTADDIFHDGQIIYRNFQIDAKNVAGMSAMDPDMQAQGVPPFWASYVKHSDVDSIAAKATAAGGSVMFPPMDVMESGRMTMIQDPAGATFGVWQPRDFIGAELVNMPNTLVWNELQTRDVGAAQKFYGAVFGWDFDKDPNNYHLCTLDGRIHAGILQIDESWGPMPSNWGVYFMVEDIHAAAAKAQELGGKLLVQPTKAGDLGTFVVVQDPQGAAFTMMQFDGAVDTPPGA